jgi:hypothetical protein
MIEPPCVIESELELVTAPNLHEMASHQLKVDGSEERQPFHPIR